ncbi:hypothetical protein Avbf_03861 [Armadillidium vulgare]|nr:hypothetical protein Avbf_03861 [Armadillidium vulgare]
MTIYLPVAMRCFRNLSLLDVILSFRDLDMSSANPGTPWSYNHNGTIPSNNTGSEDKNKNDTTLPSTGIPGTIEDDTFKRRLKIEKQRQLVEARAQKKRQNSGVLQPSERALSARRNQRPGTASSVGSRLSGGMHGE